MSSEVSRHHCFWNRAWYRSPIQKTLRNHEGLVTPMYHQIHRELHVELQPPPKPNSNLILGALSLLDDLPSRTLRNPAETVLALSEHFLEQDNNLSQRLGHHLLKQSAFITEGMVHLD